MGLALSRINWTSGVFLLPYLLFWLWVLVVAVLLIRRGSTVAHNDEPAWTRLKSG